MAKETLTEEERQLMIQVRDEYLNAFLNLPRFDDEAGAQLIELVYKWCGFGKPALHVCTSPRDAQIKVNEAEGVSDSAKRKHYSYASYVRADDMAWIAFYDFFRRIGLVNNADFDTYRELFMRAGIFAVIAFDTDAFIVPYPKCMYTDEAKRLHSTEGKAIEWEDGWGLYFIHGVQFNEELYTKAVTDRAFTGREILAVSNAEQQTTLIQLYGLETVIDQLNPRVIDEYQGVSQATDQPVHYKLMEYELFGSTFRAILLEDHTTHKPCVRGVPREKGTETCAGAVAWTFGLKPDEYHPEYET